MARGQRDYLVSIFNDLKGCYDRARPALDTVTMRRMRLLKSVVVCHVRTLRKIKYCVRIGFEILEEHLQCCVKTNPGGLEQGNGGGA